MGRVWMQALTVLRGIESRQCNDGEEAGCPAADPCKPAAQVLGNVKGVVAVVASILWFRNPVNVASMMGYGITVSGVVAYSQARCVGALLMRIRCS